MTALINSITENGLLYLLTTIAQCLAGAIALLAAFALYSLGSINKATVDLGSLIVQAFQVGSIRNESVTGLASLLAEGRFQAFGAKYDQLVEAWPVTAVPRPDAPSVRDLVVRFRANMDAQKRIRSSLWPALLITGAVMTLSILAMPAARFLICYPCRAWTIAGGFLILFGVCLWLFYRVIRAALPAEEKDLPTVPWA